MLPEQFVQFGAEASPFKRIGEGKDIAEVVAFLASEASGWLTGQNIRANGGVHML
jgi:3-oxoacyl-[acyl-carrier protein] reductase